MQPKHRRIVMALYLFLIVAAIKAAIMVLGVVVPNHTIKNVFMVLSLITALNLAAVGFLLVINIMRSFVE